MTTREATMPDIARDTLRGGELPKRLAAQLGKGTDDDVYLIEARRLSPEDVEKLRTLRADIQLGLDDLDAGRMVDGEELFARLEKKYFSSSGS